MRRRSGPPCARRARLAVPERPEASSEHEPDPPLPLDSSAATTAVRPRDPSLTCQPAEAAAPRHRRSSEGIGSILAGKYKLVEEIGEGGMGTVCMAQQTEPVKRAVAVKVIKAGMDSKAVLARFEAERQALAMMDHPNIAKVLDAGTTDAGRPFFVMELVKGVPITQFCDERKLTAAAAAGTVRAGLPGDPARPPEGRSSTATSSRRTSWSRCTTTAGAQGHRLRRRQGRPGRRSPSRR